MQDPREAATALAAAGAGADRQANVGLLGSSHPPHLRDQQQLAGVLLASSPYQAPVVVCRSEPVLGCSPSLPTRAPAASAYQLLVVSGLLPSQAPATARWRQPGCVSLLSLPSPAPTASRCGSVLPPPLPLSLQYTSSLHILQATKLIHFCILLYAISI